MYSHWLKLPINTRHTIAIAFGIKKSGATEVANNEVVKDGYGIHDIESALNIDALQKYLNTDETDFLVLWDWLIAATESRPRTMASTITVATEEEPILVPENGHDIGGFAIDSIPKKRRGRPKKA